MKKCECGAIMIKIYDKSYDEDPEDFYYFCLRCHNIIGNKVKE